MRRSEAFGGERAGGTMDFDGFLRLDGFTGTSKVSGREGEFEVLDYDLDLAQLFPPFGTDPEFAPLFDETFLTPLYVDVRPGDGDIEGLLSNLAGGKFISGGELDLVAPSATGTTQFQSISLTGIQVLGYGQGAGETTRLALGFKTIEIEAIKLDGLGNPTKAADDDASITIDVAGDDRRFVVDAGFFEIDDVTPFGSETVFLNVLREEAAIAIDGGSTAKGFEGQIEVVDFDFDILYEGATVQPVFSPLIVELNTSEGALLQLQRAMGRGEILDLTLNRTTDGTAAGRIQTITLDNAVLIGFDAGTGGTARASFDFTKVKIDDENGASADTVFEFDRTEDRSTFFDRSSEVFRPAEEESGPTAYFMKIDGVTGNVDLNGEAGWIAVAAYDYELERDPFTFDGGGPPREGHVEIGPLVVDIDEASLGTVQAGLIGALAKATSPGVTLVGATPDGTGKLARFEEITLDNAILASYDEDRGLLPRVAFGFETIQVESFGTDGKRSGLFEAEFSSSEGQVGLLFDRAPLSEFDADSALVRASAANEAIFVGIEGFDGASSANGRTGQFDVASFDFEIDTVSFDPVSSGLNGETEFEPLVIEFERGDPALAGLLKSAFDDQKIKEINLEVTRDTGGEAPVVVQSIALNDAYVVGYEESDDATTSVAFGFGKATLKYSDLDAFGVISKTVETEFDVAGNGFAFDPQSDGQVGDDAGGGATGEMFLKLGNDVSGNTLDPDHKGFFDVKGYSLAFEADAIGEEGKIVDGELSPLLIDVFPGHSGIAGIIGELASDTDIVGDVVLEVYRPNGVDFERITLTGADVTSYREGSSGSDLLASRIALDYSKIKIESFADTDGNGKLTSSVRVEHDVGALPFDPPRDAEIDASVELGFLVDAFLEVDGVEGSSVVSGFEDQIDVLDYDFDLDALRGGSVGGGNANIDLAPLRVTFAPGEFGAVALLSETLGEQIPEATLRLARNDFDGGLVTFEEIRLQNVRVLEFSDNEDGIDVEFGYSLLDVAITDFDKTGAQQTPAFALDLRTDDFVVGNDGDNTLNGGDGDDTLFALGGDDTVNGGDGNDSLNAGSGEGNDDYDGGADIDEITYRSTSQGIVVDLQAGTGTGVEIDNDTIVNVENVVGGRGNDTIRGDGNDNRLDGGAGAGVDSLFGRGGDDVLVASFALDKFGTVSGAGDTYDGGEGTDTYLIADTRADSLDFNIGLSGGTDNFGNTLVSIENVISGSGNDFIGGTGGTNRLEGGGGNDVIFGGFGAADIVIGGEGDDRFQIEAGNVVGETIDGGEGFDQLQLFGSGNAIYDFRDDTLVSIERAFVQHGTSGSISVRLAAAQINGGLGAVDIAGDRGTATFGLSISMSGETTLDLTAFQIGGFGAPGDTVFIAGGSASETITTGDFATTFLDFGIGGGDTLIGGAANDTFDASTGDLDTMTGNGGDDRYFIDNVGDVVIEAAGEGTDTMLAYVDATLADNVENLELLLSGLTGTGNALANRLTGTNGTDTLDGAGGNDRIEGGEGADALTGGDGIDTAFYGNATSGVQLDLRSLGSGGEAAGDTFASIENVSASRFADVVVGTQGANALIGGISGDVLFGLGGNDQLIGGAGKDRLLGGEGADVIDGGANADVASYAAASSGITINLALGRGTRGEAAGDTLISIDGAIGSAFADVMIGFAGVNVLFGGDGNDYIDASSGNDIVRGDAGDDTVIGGAGNDRMSGGTGADDFVFADGYGRDRIDDFEDGIDTLDFASHSGVASIGDLTIRSFGTSAVVEDGQGGVVVIGGAAGLIDASDFEF